MLVEDVVPGIFASVPEIITDKFFFLKKENQQTSGLRELVR